MKLKKIKIKKYKLMRMYLTKYEAYIKDSSFMFVSDNVLDRLEIGFKKALFIIYQYHIYSKRILFIGLPYSRDKKILRVFLNSNHIFIPRSVWQQGLIGNKNSVSQKLKKKIYFQKFLEVKENPHLVVIFNEDNLSNMVSEILKLSIPIVYFGNSIKGFEGISYFIKGNFVKKKMKNFFHFLIYSILKQPRYK